jgi:hypothetical protein
MGMSAAERSARYRAKDIDAYRSKKRALAKTEKHRNKRTEYMRTYREKNREAFNAMCNASHKRNRARTFLSRRADHLKRTYGITIEQFDEMLKAQNGRCLICGVDKPRGTKSWHVDHCHETGKIRGLLCNMCNPRLGWFESYKDSIHKYLEVNV